MLVVKQFGMLNVPNTSQVRGNHRHTSPSPVPKVEAVVEVRQALEPACTRRVLDQLTSVSMPCLAVEEANELDWPVAVMALNQWLLADSAFLTQFGLVVQGVEATRTSEIASTLVV